MLQSKGRKAKNKIETSCAFPIRPKAARVTNPFFASIICADWGEHQFICPDFTFSFNSSNRNTCTPKNKVRKESGFIGVGFTNHNMTSSIRHGPTHTHTRGMMRQGPTNTAPRPHPPPPPSRPAAPFLSFFLSFPFPLHSVAKFDTHHLLHGWTQLGVFRPRFFQERKNLLRTHGRLLRSQRPAGNARHDVVRAHVWVWFAPRQRFPHDDAKAVNMSSRGCGLGLGFGLRVRVKGSG
jgi:hypothetical protein